jgi:hypothetical protein
VSACLAYTHDKTAVVDREGPGWKIPIKGSERFGHAVAVPDYRSENTTSITYYFALVAHDLAPVVDRDCLASDIIIFA